MKFILLILVFLTTSAYAENFSMRKCMLLPITDTAGNSLGYKIFENLEKRLKRDGWCDYVSSSEVIGIFSKYREKLNQYLNDENVLKTVASRLKVGTMIRVSLQYDIDKVTIKFDVIGENGVDVYMSEKTIINEIHVDPIMTAINNWIELYEETIPYDGKVLGVLGDQITFSFPKSKNIVVGQDITIKRLKNKKRHPLLKKIVEWDSLMLAKGKVFNTARGQALGVVKVYTTNKKLEVGDWITLEKLDPSKIQGTRKFKQYEENKFGKLGEMAISFTTSSHSTSSSLSTGTAKMGGFLYGISLAAEAWVTRNYFAVGEFSRRVGNMTKQGGSPSSTSAGQSAGTLRIGAGYKYLPMGFFYGPQVDLYTGYVKYSYQVDKSAADGFGANSFSGLYVGVGGSIPLKKTIKVYGKGEILPFGGFTDEDGIFGSKKSISSMRLDVGVHYNWSPTIKLLGGFEVLNNSAKLSGSPSEISYRDSQLKVGGVFTF